LSSARLPAASTAYAALLCGLLTSLLFTARPASQGAAATYTLYTAEGRQTIAFRTSGAADLVPLDRLASLFNLTLTEDTLVGGLIVRGAGQTILLIPGQSFASIGPGRVVSLPAPVTRDRGLWEVPVEFIRQALGPALGQPVEIRRATRVILVGAIRLPQVSGRAESLGPVHRVTLETQPPAPRTVTRAGNRLIVQFDAVALDFQPIPGLAPEFVTNIQVDGASLVFMLGPTTAGYRIDDSAPSRLVIDLMAPGPPPDPAAPASAPEAAPDGDPPPLDLTPPGTIRSVVIDPGHGGGDTGVRGPGNQEEKDVVLRLARRLKSAIESRIGLRVILTRDDDTDVPLDRRASIANNNKADLFISLHTNASVRPAVAGTQVLSLSLDDYRGRIDPADATPLSVPVVGGGTRTIDIVPWDIAQVSFADQSATVAAILERHLGEQDVPLFRGPVSRMPLRTLVGAHMPAIMIEAGFLTNPEDAQALGAADHPQRIVTAIVDMLNEIRNGIPPAVASEVR
jgi:N-acetylmuramoyl-L-alanine amidase